MNVNQINNDSSSNVEELKYLKKVEKIIKYGKLRNDRTGVGTLSLFGVQLRYNLQNVFWRAIVEELLWFIRGETNSKTLSSKGIKIWDANGSREFLNANGFKDRVEGDLGPVYGFQWRHYGAEYIDCFTDYTGKGIDQLQNVIDQIKNNPESRRIILCAWNPNDINKMVLPPCHTLCQFYVADGELSCQLYQRSGDMGLGVPFNIASYALLTHMIAKITNLKPGYFVHTLGDAHVYTNHVNALKEQLLRQPRPFPTIYFKENIKKIEDFTYESIVLENYNPYPSIKMEMAL